MKPDKSEKTAFARYVRPTLLGAAAGTLVCFLLLLIMAAVLTAGDIPKRAVGLMALGAAAAGAFFGAMLCAALAKRRGWLFGLACSGVLLLPVIIAGWAVTGQLSALLPLKAAVLLLCGVLGGMLGVNLRKK